MRSACDGACDVGSHDGRRLNAVAMGLWCDMRVLGPSRRAVHGLYHGPNDRCVIIGVQGIANRRSSGADGEG